jgi:gliding motility-associated-like protein
VVLNSEWAKLGIVRFRNDRPAVFFSQLSKTGLPLPSGYVNCIVFGSKAYETTNTFHPMIKRFKLFWCFLLLTGSAMAQNPTNQDCLNAIPICQNVYSTTASYSGEGNILNEINSGSSCLGSGELNDVWYTFTVQQSGNLNFLITPNNAADDYDWAVYNLTNNNCSDIYTMPGLEVSCNFSATPGTTGPNGGSAQTSQSAIGTPYNAVIPVAVGQTYVINVSNFSSSQNGYTINFSASTAVIFDQIPPQILTVNNPGCGGNTLTVTFSENILCNTVQSADFSFTGPGGPYVVTSVTSVACAQGAQYDNTFTFTISPNITSAGTYFANLVGPVTDLCGNVAIFPAQLPFTVGSFTYTNTIVPATCAGNNGTASIAVVGTGPFTYVWSPNVSSTNSATGLGANTYYVTITDQSTGCTAVDTLMVTTNNTLSVQTSGDDTICPGSSVVISATISGGNAPFTFTWSNSLPNQSSVTVSPSTTTTYTLNIVDAQGCSAGPLLFTITVASPVSVTASGTSPICVGTGAVLNAVAAGGYGGYNFVWNPGNINGATVNVSPAVTTTYTVTLTDGCGQTANASFQVFVQQLPLISFTADTLNGCTPLTVQFSMDTSGFGGGVTYLWDFDDNGATSNLPQPQHTFLTAGCHDISLTVTVPPGCSVTQTIPCMITTLPQPNASFNATPVLTDILNPTITFDNTSSGGNNWLWSYGDNSTSTVFEESHTYGEPGEYPVYLIVTNTYGCSDTAIVDISVKDYHTFYVPNAFTPDGNDRNETFGPVFTNILTEGFDMQIYDRWGNLVYQTNDPYDPWNGRWKNKGDIVQQDVYVYMISYTDNLYRPYQMVGHVTVIR